MQNKKLTYILIPAVLAIWGIIGYRIFGGLNEEGDVKTSHRKQGVRNSIKNRLRFQLLENYKNPFVTTRDYQPAEKTKASSKTKPQSEPSPAQTVSFNFASVKYGGLITGKSRIEKMGLFTVNDKNYILANGDSAESFIIYELYKDSAIIKKKNQKITLARGKDPVNPEHNLNVGELW